jgi:hypothetical protein
MFYKKSEHLLHNVYVIQSVLLFQNPLNNKIFLED